MYLIKIYNSISLIKKEDWDVLTENNIFMCYEYLKTFEETTKNPLQPYYITVTDEGKLAGASVCHLEQKNDARILDKVFLGKLHKYGWKKSSFLPALICNRQRGAGTHFIFHPELSRDQIIFLQNKMLDEIENIAESNNVPVCFMNVTEDQADFINLLKQKKFYGTMDLPTTFIDIKWSSFEGYIDFLSNKYSNMHKSIRHELNKLRKSGVVIERIENVNAHQERLLELLKKNHFKYNSNRFPLNQNYFQKIKENFGNNGHIYTAVKEGVIVGVKIMLIKGKEVYHSGIGIDYELSKNDFTFFNLAYYEPIKYAIQCKIRRIYYGRGLYHAKIRRGCTPKTMFIFYRPQNNFTKQAVKLWFGFHKQWMKRKLKNINDL